MRKTLTAGCLFFLILAGCVQPPARMVALAPTHALNAPRILSTPAPVTTDNPPPCSEADLVYHTRLKQMLLVNCVADPSTPTLLTIWGWDGTHWHKLTQDGPPERILGGVAFDDVRNVLVLYGGRPVQLGQCSQETWEWDGEFWEQKNAAPPTACDHVRMVYDEATQKSILFSGLDPSENRVNETWSWNGEHWKLLSEDGPESRGHFGLVYDPAYKQILLYGGYASTISDEFWAWKKDSWHEINDADPGALSHFGMALDPAGNGLLLFGGATSTSTFSSLTDKTWVLRENGWQQLHPANSPFERGGPAMGYDPLRKRVILYGGFDADRHNLNDTWEWDGRNWICRMNCQSLEH